MTGAVPVPVPPPMPAVKNTRSAPSKIFSSASREASAHLRPTSGYPPAPRPRVMDAPTSTFLMDSAIMVKCIRSVFIAIVSAPRIPARARRLTELQPAPPVPTTMILGVWNWKPSSPPFEAPLFFAVLSASATISSISIHLPLKNRKK